MNQNETENIIKGILSNIPLQVEEVVFSYDSKDQALWCQIKTKESRFFMGRDGEALTALNHLVRKIVEKHFFDIINNSDKKEIRPFNQKIVIDINNFQKNKIENLKTTAHMLSERVKFFKSNIETSPLSAFDRKTIHEFLAEKPNIKTESIGIEPNRRVLIKYAEN